MGMGQEIKDFVGAFAAGYKMSSDAINTKEDRALARDELAIKEKYYEALILSNTAEAKLKDAQANNIINPPESDWDKAYRFGVGKADGAIPSSSSTAPPSVEEITKSVIEESRAYGATPEEQKFILAMYDYETAGSMDPWKKGPTTKWGEHRGLIQWGGPQREEYGVTQGMPVRDQVKASLRYIKDRGYKFGSNNMVSMYATVNGGNAKAVNARDAAAGGAPGTVAEKVRNQFGPHIGRANNWFSMFGDIAALPVEDDNV
jgi:hypothetical protein